MNDNVLDETIAMLDEQRMQAQKTKEEGLKRAAELAAERDAVVRTASRAEALVEMLNDSIRELKRLAER